MPYPSGRRHPLFLRLQKPIGPIYPAAVAPIAWDDEEPIEEAEGVVFLATRPSGKLKTWAAQLRNLLDADETYKTEDSISSLSGKPIRARSLAEIGRWDHELWNADFSRIRTSRCAHRAHASVTQMAIVLDRLDGQAVGFVSFDIRWTAEAVADPDDDSAVRLAVEYDQAWMAPAYRRRRWGETAAIGIAFAVKRHVDQIAASTRWPRGFIARTTLTVGADIYSTSGERFLETCAQYMSFQFDLTKGDRIEVVEIELESRI